MFNSSFFEAVGSAFIMLILLVFFVTFCVIISKIITKYLKSRRMSMKEREATRESAKRLKMTEQQIEVLQKICDFLNEKEEESQHDSIS